MTTTTYEFTAYTEADLLNAGAEGYGVSCGDTFTMPAGATTCIEVADNDAFLSGDNYCNENANDHYGQNAAITGEGGNELGNGGQIYAEKYFWVCDDAGNWYVMIEIEQEGSNDDFFTFYTGHGYTVPEEGTELTVYSSCNVRGEWIDYKCLDAGEKGPETGSISGRVFCDDDCDGIDGGVTIIEGCDYTIEAEDMDAWGFKTVHGEHASGGELVKLQCAGQSAAIKTDFQGKDGVYDVSLFIQDECDGQSKIKLLVNGQLVEAIRLDGDNNGGGSNNGGFSEFVIQGVEIKAGDEIKIWAEGDGYEFVRIDKLEFNGRDQEVRTEEPGKEGVVVVLLDADGNEVLDDNGDRIETVTDANGEYTFDGVPVGEYRVKFENPDGTEFTFQNAGSDDAIDSDVDSNGVSDVISVVADQTTTDVDAGLKPAAPEPGSLSGRYFFDADRDGLDNDGMNGIEGIQVELLDENGDGTGITTTTDADGNYSFGGLDAGTYGVKFTDSDTGRELTTQDANGNANDDIDSDAADIGGGMSTINGIVVVAGQDTPDNDAGVVELLGSLSGRYFCDDDGDGLDNDGPNGGLGEGVEGIRVDLLDAAGNLTGDFTFTAADGSYSFENLSAGTYGVQFAEAPPTKDFTTTNVDNDQSDDIDSDAVANANGTATIAAIIVVAGQNTPDNDVGVTPEPGSLSGRYFFDADRDGLDNDGMNGIEGIQVELLDENGDGTGITTTTDADGNYSFGGLDAGTYGVKFTDSDTGRELTTQDANGNANDDIDSDAADIGGGMSTINGIVVVAGQDTPDNDAGVVELLGSLSGRYFSDEDRDGLDNDGMNGIEGIVVELLDENGDGTGITTTTDADGNYSFGGLSAGDYGVKFTDPDATRELTTQDANGNANDDIDSDASDVGGGMSAINGITVVAGQDTPDNDAGVVELLGSLSGRYFCDDNGDGLDNDSDLGGEGPGVEGVRVDLLDENGDPTGQFTVTDADGNYSFANLPAGSYGVRFESGQLDKELTIQDVNNNGNDDIDSDAMSDDQGQGFAVIPNIVVLPGQNTPDNDIGVTPANADPEAEDVAAAVCADDMATINLLDAVFDVDGDALTLSISDADETAGVGESITLESGGVVTLNADGTVTFNPNGAYDDLVIRDSVMDQFQFTADDGNGGTATANADIKVCGALNTIDTINESLPDTATVTYRFSNDGAFQVDIDSDDPRLDTDGFTIDVFCVDFDTLFINGAQVETNIYASVDMQPDATPDQIDALPDGIVPNEENLDLVNWILNQDFRNMDNGDGTGETYTGGEIQDAIWFLTNDRPIPDDTVFNPGGQANSQEIVDFALNDINMDGVADGGAEGFVAGEGDLVGVILAPALDANAVDVDTGELIPLDNQPLQPFIVGIRFEDLEEACDCVL